MNICLIFVTNLVGTCGNLQCWFVVIRYFIKCNAITLTVGSLSPPPRVSDILVSVRLSSKALNCSYGVSHGNEIAAISVGIKILLCDLIRHLVFSIYGGL